MVVTRASGGGFQRLFGLAADPKPTDGIQTGSEFIETDTGTAHLFDGTSWFEYSIASGGGSGGGVSIADGLDATQGATADAAVAAGAVGTQSAKLRRLSADMGAILAGLQDGTLQITTPALRGTPVAAVMTTSLTTTTRTIVPWITGRAPDGAEDGYITSIIITVVGNAGGYLSLHDGDTPTVIARLPLPNKSADADVGGAVIPIPDTLVITSGNSLYVTPSAAQDGLYISAHGFEGTTAPA